MKYIKYFLIIILIPFMVLAEECDIENITITSIEQKSIEGKTFEAYPPEIVDRSVYLDLIMHEVGDSITYEMTVQNESDEDYMIDEDTFKTNSEYIEYTLKTNDNSNVVKAKSTKDVYLTVSYKNEIEDSLLNNNTFNASNSLMLSLNTNDEEKPLDVITADTIKESVAPKQEVENPDTNVSNIKLIIAILLIVIIIITLTFYGKKQYIKYFIILLSIVITPIIYATCKVDVELDSYIIIDKNPVINGTIYRNNTKTLNIGESVYAKDVKKWCIMMHKDGNSDLLIGSCETENSNYTYVAEQYCLNNLEFYNTEPSWVNAGYTFTCEEKTIEKGLGEYYTDPSQINKSYYLKHIIEHNIVKESYVCFVIEGQEHCLRGGVSGENTFCGSIGNWDDCAPIYNQNYNKIRSLSAWYRDNGGKCSDRPMNGVNMINCERKSPYITAGADGFVYASDVDVDTNRYNDGTTYCLVNGRGNSVCY